MRLFSTQTEGDLTTNIYADDTGTAVIEKVQDHREWIERNRAIRDTATGHESLRHIGFIPDFVIDQWRREGIDIFNKDDMPKIIAKLNTNEFHLLKSTEGAI